METSQQVAGNAMAVQVTQWSQLPDVDSAERFSEADIKCLSEVREVLARHNQLGRFGVSLLHTHFKVEDDEFLLETTDVGSRTQTIRPVKADDFAGRDDIVLIATSMRLVDGAEVAVACTKCQTYKSHPYH